MILREQYTCITCFSGCCFFRASDSKCNYVPRIIICCTYVLYNSYYMTGEINIYLIRVRFI